MGLQTNLQRPDDILENMINPLIIPYRMAMSPMSNYHMQTCDLSFNHYKWNCSHHHNGNRSPPHNESKRAKRYSRSRTRSKTPMNGQKRCSRSCSPSQKHTKVKGGAERPSKSRSKSPYHDHRTPRETFPITHHDNAETPKMLNNRKNY